jgi:nucleoside-diphosphate-sugar epimerase
MAGALAGSGKPLVVTSGTALLAPGRIGTQNDAPSPESPGYFRAPSERVLEAADRGVRVSVVRLPPKVHGAGDRGFVPMLIDLVRRTGFAAVPGDGANRWPAVHRLDAARLFRLALEHAAPGSRLHGVAEEGIPMRAIAEAIGAGLGVPVRSPAEAAAQAHFGWLAGFVAIHNPSSGALTRERLAWRPRQAGLLADMRQGGYFA